MELNKLLRRKQKVIDENNQHQLAEVCHKLGNVYMSQSKLDSALKEFNQELAIRESLESNKLDIARVNRMIGEVLMLKGRYSEAQKKVQIYLKIAKECNDLVELQRAHATIGRCYLLKAEDESVGGSDNPVIDYKAAEKAFLKSLIICKELTRSVTKWELSDMQARLYLNLGVTKEHVEEFDEAINYYETAIKICKSNDLFELQHQCLIATALNYSLKRHDNAEALSIFNKALEVSKRIHDKNEKTCETLLAMSNVLTKNGDFQGAKQALKKAYKLKSPNQNDREAIEKSLKVVYTICKSEDELVITSSFDYSKRKNLFEKLGDGACKLKNFKKGIDFYLKTLEAAELNGEGAVQLVPIYVSLYQTYIDNKEYKEALEYMRKEYDIIRDDSKEAAATLLGIANISDLSSLDFWEVESIFKQALEESRKACDIAMEKNILKKFIQFCHKRRMMTIADMLEQEAIGKGIEFNVTTESSEEFESCSEDILEISNDIDLDQILSSDAESDGDKSCDKLNDSAKRTKRAKKQTFKVNAKGETKLHEACINGNYQLAKLLIDQGHAVNVRDNAGWMPLHEAANHGYADIVELLLDNGAQSAINDKGGVSCDGITPLHDAAINGHLSTVLVLLNRGARATMKTNNNETALEMLLRWYKDNARGMSVTEKELYSEIQMKLSEQCERVGIEIKSRLEQTSSSGYHSTCGGTVGESSQANLRYRAILSDESDSEENKQDENIARNARDEYRNVMKSLKNPHKQQQKFTAEPIEAKRKSALLTENDVDIQDWLEDDLGPTKKKSKIAKENSPLKTLQKKPSTNNVENIYVENHEVVSSDEDSRGINAFDVIMSNNTRGLIGLQSKFDKRKSDSTKVTAAAQAQSSLLEKGFSRFIEPEVMTSKQNLHDSVDKQIIIKVQVGGERVIVPVCKETIGNCKISWLIDETSNRYYLLKGIRPDLILKDVDGATLLSTDSLALIFSLTDENVIHSEILDWKLPPLEKRYIEACSEYKCTVDGFMNELLSNNRNSLSISLANLNLNASNVRPIMKSLQHQSVLSEFNLSNNFIQNEGIKFLSQTLATLKCLNSLDISGNSVTEIGVEYLTNTLTKSQLPSEIRQLNMSFNPLKNASLKFISDICRLKHVNSLSIASCDLSAAENLNEMSTLKYLDISYNHFNPKSLQKLLQKLKSSNVESLILERCSNEFELGEVIVEFIDSGSYLSLVELNLSGLELNENEILDILRCIDKCERLKIMNLSNIKSITFLSLKYLLFSLECETLERVHLLNCRQLRDVTNLNCLQSTNNGIQSRPMSLRHIQLSLPREPSIRRDFVDKMKELWTVLCGGHDKIEENKTTLLLSRDDDDRPLPH